MELTIRIEKVYGVTKIYPVDKNAKFFTTLTGKKTLTSRDILTIENLGFTINTQIKGD